jgi:hypothetical protein
MTVAIDPTTMQAPNSTLTVEGSAFTVGYQGSLSALALPSSLVGMSGVSVSGNQITITANNFVLSNVNFTGYYVVVAANNVTINNCLAGSDSYFTVRQPNAAHCRLRPVPGRECLHRRVQRALHSISVSIRHPSAAASSGRSRSNRSRPT